MNDNNIYSKAIAFTIVSAVVILIGSIITMGIPLMMEEMHPKMETLKPYSAIELQGRNIYQREGCMNCHSQLVRPLTADVVRYGEYTRAGEEYYERPFLWGSKRTGPDLARVGLKYTADWHIAHLKNPQAFYPQSNMPKYAFLDRKADAKEAEASMKVLGFPYTQSDIDAVRNASELEALASYLVALGREIPELYVKIDPAKYESMSSPITTPSVRVKKLYAENCASCHGDKGQGTELGGSMADNAPSTTVDGQLFVTIANGLEGMMPGSVGFMTLKDMWGLAVYSKELGSANAK